VGVRVAPWTLSASFSKEIVIATAPCAPCGVAGLKGRGDSVWRRLPGSAFRALTDWYWLAEQPVSVTIFYFPNATMCGELSRFGL
jgi:hypothetical protein